MNLSNPVKNTDSTQNMK